MDIPVSNAVKQRRQRRRWLLIGSAAVALAAITLGLSRLQPAAPRVEKSAVWMDTVRRGEMLRQVRGNGTLVPEDIRWIPTVNAGRVERILVLPGAAVASNTVLVDVALGGALPKGARPDLSVDGTIELERLEDVLYVGRPVQGQPDSTAGLFKVVDGKAAMRVQVKLGRCSVSTIEVVEGLQVGDQVILSDMSQWDAHERVRLD